MLSPSTRQQFDMHNATLPGNSCRLKILLIQPWLGICHFPGVSRPDEALGSVSLLLELGL